VNRQTTKDAAEAYESSSRVRIGYRDYEMSRGSSRVTTDAGEEMPVQEGLGRRAGSAISHLLAMLRGIGGGESRTQSCGLVIPLCCRYAPPKSAAPRCP